MTQRAVTAVSASKANHLNASDAKLPGVERYLPATLSHLTLMKCHACNSKGKGSRFGRPPVHRFMRPLMCRFRRLH